MIRSILLGFGFAFAAGVQPGPLRRGPGTPPSRSKSGPRTLLQAALVNLFNPNPYLGWTLVLGPAVIFAWHERPSHAIALVATFYATMIASLVAFILLASTARGLGPRGQRALVLASALLLGGLGVVQLVAALGHGAA